MNQILCCDWLPEQARWSYLASMGLPKHCVPKEKFLQKPYNKSFVGQTCSVKMTNQACSVKFMDLHLIPVHNQAQKVLGQYPAFLTLHLVNNPYLLYGWLLEQANPAV